VNVAPSVSEGSGMSRFTAKYRVNRIVYYETRVVVVAVTTVPPGPSLTLGATP